MVSILFKKFLSNKNGGYAVVFALLSLPLIGVVGMSVDYANASRLRSKLHTAIDAAGVATAQIFLSEKLSNSELSRYSQDFFMANFEEEYAKDVKFKLETTPQSFRLDAKFTYRPMFAPVFAAFSGTSIESFDYIIE